MYVCQFPPLDKNHGVRVLCICPGFTDTPIATGVLNAYENLKVDTKEIMTHFTMQQ
jgi:NAD(P)-dependent dehydrogenase (short-subunit alcohol dehydrogenase family)